MRKIVSVFLLIFMLVLLFSCAEEPSAEELMKDFISSYGAEGIIYSPRCEVYEDGYIREGFTEKIYIYNGNFPKNYAIFLNSHSHRGSEAALFVCKDENEKQTVLEMCLERVKTVCDGSDNCVIIRSGNIIAYSTLEDKGRSENLLRKIISSHT